MTQDATSESGTTDTSATEDDTTAQDLLADAAAESGEGAEGGTDTGPKPGPKPAADELGDGGKRALLAERQARRDAEKQLADMRTQLQGFTDRDKTELQKALERAENAEKTAATTRVANARLMAAATHNVPADLIPLLGDGTDEEIDARAKLLADRLAAAVPAPVAETKPPANTRPVESLTPGAKPASAKPADANDVFREFVAARRST